MDINKFLKLIREGESESVEFKRRAAGIAAEICGFANANGGYILVGVDDSGDIIGANPLDEEKIVSEIQALNPMPKIAIEKIRIDDKLVLIVKVEKSRDLVAMGKTAYVRIGRGRRPLSIDEIIVRATELLRFSYDMAPSPAPASIVNREYVMEYLRKREEVRGVPARGSLDENLKKLKITTVKNGVEYLTVAGLLFFTDNPQEYMPHTGVRVVELDENYNTISTKEFKGTIWRIIENVETYLVSKFKVLSVYKGFKRIDYLEYPRFSIREAIVNALAHRNYTIQADTRIMIFPDKLIVKNPGSFPPGVSPENPEHIPRNKLICQYLYDMGYIERYGYGIERMKKECEEHPFVKLKFNVAPLHTEVIFEKEKPREIDEVDEKILALLRRREMKASEISREIKLSKTATIARLKKLMEIGLVKKKGRGPATTYYA